LERDSGVSQFFITVVDTTYLDFDTEPLTSTHAVFGYDLEGMEVADAIALVDTGGDTKPEVDVVIFRITIVCP
jgi:cyclophilin family peptidyl-prolyl cis-trans isomerase